MASPRANWPIAGLRCTIAILNSPLSGFSDCCLLFEWGGGLELVKVIMSISQDGKTKPAVVILSSRRGSPPASALAFKLGDVPRTRLDEINVATRI